MHYFHLLWAAFAKFYSAQFSHEIIKVLQTQRYKSSQPQQEVAAPNRKLQDFSNRTCLQKMTDWQFLKTYIGGSVLIALNTKCLEAG